jgi:hypothetical protein
LKVSDPELVEKSVPCPQNPEISPIDCMFNQWSQKKAASFADSHETQ